MPKGNRLLDRILIVPRLLVGSFLLVILLGCVLLFPSISTADGTDPLGLVEILFTSTSAVCVTGLVVRDTATELSFYGQAVVLLLIQLGGLGILTFSTFFLVARTGRLGLAERGLIEQTHGQLSSIHPASLIKRILIYTFTIEAVAALILALRFASDYPFAKALWLGVFMSISGFCNAGFSLFSDSLASYQDDWLVNLVMMALIVSGGLGFVVLADLAAYIRHWRRRRLIRLSLHSRVVLWSSFFLIGGGALLFFLFELLNPQGGENLVQRTLPMVFLSVTARTAGFNTVEISQLTNSTLLLLIVLMAIGASPGSTGGGVKTTTAAAIFSLVLSRVRSRPNPELLDRSLPPEVVSKALATVVGFLLTLIAALLLLEMTEVYSLPYDAVRGRFFGHLFEVVSALGTVGLSTGITPDLSPAGKLIITACMFLGRLGPLVVGVSLIGKKHVVPYTLPEESIIIG